MVFGIFSRKIDRVRIYQDVRRVEQHFQNTILGSDPPVENIIEEFDQVLAEIPVARVPAMLEPLLRLEELSTAIVSSFYAIRICVRLRGNLRRQVRSEELSLYERACAKHLEFLGELDTVFYPEIIRDKKMAAQVANRQFHWLCELTKIACLRGEAVPEAFFEAAEGIVTYGEEQGIMEEVVSPYPALYPEERASIAKNLVRQYLITAFVNSELPGADLDVANTLWRIMPFRTARFCDQKTPEVTHFLAREGSGRHVLQRVYPELDGKNVGRWFCGLRLASDMRDMAAKGEELANTALGELFSAVLNPRSMERVAQFFSVSQTRENERINVRVDTEVFTEIVDCICYLRRVNEDFLIALSDVDEKRKFNIHEQFEETKFGYVDGHVNQTTRGIVKEGIAKSLMRKMDLEYAQCGLAPLNWRIADVSHTGYGLIVPKEDKPPEIGGIVILSKENDQGIEFAVVRRFRRGDDGDVLGVELLYPGCAVDPFFILKCEEGTALSTLHLIEPYGFLLTGGAGSEAGEPSSLLLLSKKTRIPQRCSLYIKTLDQEMEGWVTGVRNEGSNWAAYQWKPL